MLKINGRLFIAMIYVIVTGINVGGKSFLTYSAFSAFWRLRVNFFWKSGFKKARKVV
jgi:hypothetical protein